MNRTTTVGGRDARVLVAGAGIIVLILAIRAVPACLRWSSDRTSAAVAAVAERNGLRLAGAQREHRLRLTLAMASLSNAAESTLVHGASRSLASASLASYVADAADGAGIALGTMQAQPADTTGAFDQISVRGTFVGDLEGITAFLAALASRPQQLVVRELTISQPDPNIAVDQVEQLRAEVVVAALARRNPIHPTGR